MAEPRDYLNPSELREMSELEADIAELRERASIKSFQRERLIKRGRARMEAGRLATEARK